jgi:hypothetical protein
MQYAENHVLLFREWFYYLRLRNELRKLLVELFPIVILHEKDVIQRFVTCQRVSARQSFIGDGSFQWEKPIFEGPPTKNPLTD